MLSYALTHKDEEYGKGSNIPLGLKEPFSCQLAQEVVDLIFQVWALGRCLHFCSEFIQVADLWTCWAARQPLLAWRGGLEEKCSCTLLVSHQRTQATAWGQGDPSNPDCEPQLRAGLVGARQDLSQGKAAFISCTCCRCRLLCQCDALLSSAGLAGRREQ